MKEYEYLIALNNVNGLGPRRILALLKKFETAKNIFKATPKDLKNIDGFGNKNIEILQNGPDVEFVENQLELAKKLNARIITYNCLEYPEKLKTIFDPPIVLHIKGEIPTAPSIGIVGTRESTIYGNRVTERLVASFVKRGITINSGMARGIDTVAHRATLDNNGLTVAVLGGGLDYFYPTKNKPLFQKIAENGALVSEFPFGRRPEPAFFPRRNRIISGLSSAIVVVEAAKKSGALITAEFAMEHGLDVYAVPGNLTSPMSAGPNKLIRDGAILLSNPDDIILHDEKSVKQKKTSVQNNIELTADEENIISLLSFEPTHIDDIMRLSSGESQDLHSTLLLLEMKGAISQTAGMRYTLK